MRNFGKPPAAYSVTVSGLQSGNRYEKEVIDPDDNARHSATADGRGLVQLAGSSGAAGDIRVEVFGYHRSRLRSVARCEALAVDPASNPPCVPHGCADAGAECGALADGCGQTVNCGSCATGSSRNANQCVPDSTGGSGVTVNPSGLIWPIACVPAKPANQSHALRFGQSGSRGAHHRGCSAQSVRHRSEIRYGPNRHSLSPFGSCQYSRRPSGDIEWIETSPKLAQLKCTSP